MAGITPNSKIHEPRLLTHMCGDETLRQTYNNNKDLYATIGSSIYHKDYWECMEHWEDGSPNPDGKKLRKKAKQLMLGRYICPFAQ